jgi:hypothetical protein
MSQWDGINHGGGGGGSNENDEAAMRVAFQQFMLQGKSENNCTKINNNNLELQKQQKEEIQRQKQINETQQKFKKAERKYWSIFHKFCNILQTHWIDIDNHSFEVITSISGMRQRLPITMKLLEQYEDEASSQESKQKCGWKYQCNKTLLVSSSMQSTNKLLQKKDVELSLSHDMLQHEKMMEGLRSLMANLSEMHEALSRALEDMMQHQLEDEQQREEYRRFDLLSDTASYRTSLTLVDVTSELYEMFSIELFRKQEMVHYLCKSVDDRLFATKQVEEMDAGRKEEIERCGPKEVAKQCLQNWQSSSSKSLIDKNLLDYSLRLHENYK